MTPVESKWTFRRLYTYAVTLVAAVLLGICVWRMAEADLRGVALSLVGLIALLATYYLIAPTAEHIVAALRAWKGDPR